MTILPYTSLVIKVNVSSSSTQLNKPGIEIGMMNILPLRAHILIKMKLQFTEGEESVTYHYPTCAITQSFIAHCAFMDAAFLGGGEGI